MMVVTTGLKPPVLMRTLGGEVFRKTMGRLLASLSNLRVERVGKESNGD
jgi:hypothetical protein